MTCDQHNLWLLCCHYIASYSANVFSIFNTNHFHRKNNITKTCHFPEIEKPIIIINDCSKSLIMYLLINQQKVIRLINYKQMIVFIIMLKISTPAGEKPLQVRHWCKKHIVRKLQANKWAVLLRLLLNTLIMINLQSPLKHLCFLICQLLGCDFVFSVIGGYLFLI